MVSTVTLGASFIVVDVQHSATKQYTVSQEMTSMDVQRYFGWFLLTSQGDKACQRETTLPKVINIPSNKIKADILTRAAWNTIFIVCTLSLNISIMSIWFLCLKWLPLMFHKPLFLQDRWQKLWSWSSWGQKKKLFHRHSGSSTGIFWGGLWLGKLESSCCLPAVAWRKLSDRVSSGVHPASQANELRRWAGFQACKGHKTTIHESPATTSRALPPKPLFTTQLNHRAPVQVQF